MAGRKSFQKLSRVWTDEENKVDMIRKWDRAAQRWVGWYERSYGNGIVDWEPIVYEALYEAVFTYDEENGAKFLTWLGWQVRSKASSYIKKQRRRSNRLTRTSYSGDLIDSRYYY